MHELLFLFQVCFPEFFILNDPPLILTFTRSGPNHVGAREDETCDQLTAIVFLLHTQWGHL